jgi:hypothetical protein
MIELKNNRIAFSAIDARVRAQMLERESAISYNRAAI